MLNLTELFLTLCSWLIWLTPFTFVFFLAHTVREVVRGGEKDVTYGGAGRPKPLYAGGGRPGNSAVTPWKRPPRFGAAFSCRFSLISGAAPDGRPQSGRG